MKKYIGCDGHRDYSVFGGLDENGAKIEPVRVEHRGDELAEFLSTLQPGTDIALEATGTWYHLVDAMENAGMKPHLAQAHAARHLYGRGSHKFDERDCEGMAKLLSNGTLPEVWIPDARTRDLRNLVRSRLALRQYQTCVKNRVLAALNRYGLREHGEHIDLFRQKGRVRLSVYVGRLPEHTRWATIREWEIVDELEQRIIEFNQQIRTHIGRIGWNRRLKTLPGIGDILAATVQMEIGDIKRFPDPEHLASYAGLVPVVHASGNKIYLGPTSPRSNHFLRWAFVEAGNVVAARQKLWPDRHVVKLYKRVRDRKCHNKAVVAVGRHLAESSWWILTKAQDYREPQSTAASASSSKNG